MIYKLFFPLTITALLAHAGAANTLRVTHIAPCAIVAPLGMPNLLSPPNMPQGARSSLPNPQMHWLELGLRASTDRGNLRPYLVGALGMEGMPAVAGAPTSCYPPLSFATSTVPQGTTGVSYTASLAANGGQPPYKWSFGRSALPSGFAIGSNGDLTGTPQVVGTYQFNVVVSDSLKNNVTGTLTLTVVSSIIASPPPTQPPPTHASRHRPSRRQPSRRRPSRRAGKRSPNAAI